jgi:hypothetical protein
MADLNYRDSGTLCHALVEMALREGQPCAAYIGRIVVVEPSKHFTYSPSSASRWINCPGSIALSVNLPPEPDEKAVTGEITAEMAEAAQIVVDWAIAQPGEKFYEQDLPIGHVTGEDDATGRTDCVIVDGDTLTVADWKFGYGEVSAEKNPQLALYALGALEVFGVIESFEKFRFVIMHPAVSKEPSVWDCTAKQLETFRQRAAQGAEWARACLDQGIDEAEDLQPGDDQCKWCRAKAICPALASVPQEVVNVDFTDLSAEQKIAEATKDVALLPAATLARFYEIVPLIEQWNDAINAAMHVSVASGDQPNYKLVAGKKGNRKWKDPTEAEALMKKMRLKVEEMYDLSLISPTSAEKLAPKYDKDGKPVPDQGETLIGVRQWPKLKELIVQGDGKPTIAKATDKRPALTVQFAELSGAEDLV